MQNDKKKKTQNQLNILISKIEWVTRKEFTEIKFEGQSVFCNHRYHLLVAIKKNAG